MARTTNSDTLPYVDSRYELGMLASQRVRDLNGGAVPVVDRDDDKLTVLALREIASGKLDVNAVRNEFVQSYKNVPTADANEESLEVASGDAPVVHEIDAELDEPQVDDVLALGTAVVEEEFVETDDSEFGDEE